MQNEDITEGLSMSVAINKGLSLDSYRSEGQPLPKKDQSQSKELLNDSRLDYAGERGGLQVKTDKAPDNTGPDVKSGPAWLAEQLRPTRIVGKFEGLPTSPRGQDERQIENQREERRKRREVEESERESRRAYQRELKKKEELTMEYSKSTGEISHRVHLAMRPRESFGKRLPHS